MTPDAPDSDASAPLPELFGPAWAERLERELAANEAYRAAAASWKGSLAFSLQPDGTPGFPASRGLFLDLAHGNCRAARPALPGDLESDSNLVWFNPFLVIFDYIILHLLSWFGINHEEA